METTPEPTVRANDVAGERRSSQKPTTSGRRRSTTHLTRWDVFLTASAAVFSPAMVLVNNTESPGPLIAVIVVMGVTVVALVIRALLVRLGASPKGSTYAVAVFVFVVMNSGYLVDSTLLGRWAPIVLALLAGVAACRFRDTALVETAVTWGAFILVLTPLVTWVVNQDDPGQPTAAATIGPVSFRSTPDVVVVVADGYASNSVLNEFYGFDNARFMDSMTSLGFEVGHDMTSNYGRTALSIPSLVGLTYPLEDGVVGASTREALYGALSGDSLLARIMRDNGYRTVYVESGWLGTRCASAVMVCVRSPWPDETLYDIVDRSALRGASGFETGRSFALGSLNAMQWLDKSLPVYLGNDERDFVYVHLLAPHPPMFLDAYCGLEGRSAVAGFAVGMPGLAESDLEIRKDAYVEQIKCVNEHLARAGADISQAGAVGLILADHGPDHLGQMYSDADEWTGEQLRERLSVLFAAHHEGCQYADLVSLVNVGRRMVSCLSGTDLPILPDRYFDLSRSGGEPEVVELTGPG